MFDQNTKDAWQGITPRPELKAAALAQAQQHASLTVFSRRRVLRLVASAAACLVLALVLLYPTPGVALEGVAPGVAMAAYSRQTPAQQTVTLLLDYDGKSQLTVSEGWLESADGSTLWHLPGPGEYTLTATRGHRTRELQVVVAMTDTGWSVQMQ